MDYGDFKVLPVEIIEHILSYVNLAGLRAIYQASKGLGVIVRGLLDRCAQRECQTEFGTIYEEAKRKCKLGWYSLYCSLELWPRLKNAEFEVRVSEPLEEHYWTSMDDEIKKLQVLKGGILGYAHYLQYDEEGAYEIVSVPSFMPVYNAIIYYESGNLNHTTIRDISYHFLSYLESDLWLALRDKNDELHAIVKEDNIEREWRLGKLESYRGRFWLVGKKLFYKSEHRKLWMAEQVPQNETIVVQNGPIEDSEHARRMHSEGVVAFTQINSEQVNVLTHKGNIYAIEGRRVTFLTLVEMTTRNRAELLPTLTQHGFDWSSPPIYKWIEVRHYYVHEDYSTKRITHLKNATVYVYGQHIILGTCHRTLHVYLNPYRNGVLSIYNKKPNINIDLRHYQQGYYDDYNDRMQSSHRKILQIDVIEILNGHRIVMLQCQKIVTIEFHHRRR